MEAHQFEAFKLQEPPEGSWRQFAGNWTSQLARSQYATHVLGLKPEEAYKFADSIVPAEVLTNVKSWHHSLILETRPEMRLTTRLCQHLEEICKLENDTDWPQASQKIQDLIGKVDFSQLRHAAWNLTTGGNPISGLIIGSAMLESQHPKDGESLIRQALRIIEESQDATKLHGDILTEFRSRFPIT